MKKVTNYKYVGNRAEKQTFPISYGMKRAFTLIETLVAISILLVAIVGPLTLASRGIASAGFAKQQVIATYLAQEAVEYIRNVRDSNKISGSPWNTGLADCIGVGVACRIDVPLGSIVPCSPGVCQNIGHDQNTGRYGYTAGLPETVFRRTITISVVPPNTDEYEVVVTVTWAGGIVPSKTITVREHILNYDL